MTGRPKLGDDDKAFEPHELAALLEHLSKRAVAEALNNRHDTRRRNALLVELMATTGLRASETAHLRLDDVRGLDHSRNPHVRVVGGKRRKPDHVATVPIPFSMVARLKVWMRHRWHRVEPGSRPLFAAARSQRAMTRGEIWRAVKQAVRACKLRPELNAHSLRHFYITRLCCQPGASPMVVANLARLRSLDLVMIYWHAARQDRRRLADALVLPGRRHKRPPGLRNA